MAAPIGSPLTAKARALTVMEVIMACAIFAVSMMVLLGIFPLSARAVRKAEARTIATNLAESQLERTRASSFVAVSNIQPYSIVTDIINNGNVESIDFTVTQNVTNLGPSSSPTPSGTPSPTPSPTPSGGTSLKHVVVTVTWTREDRQQSVYLETDIAATTP